jgi:hypothetical protein
MEWKSFEKSKKFRVIFHGKWFSAEKMYEKLAPGWLDVRYEKSPKMLFKLSS